MSVAQYVDLKRPGEGTVRDRQVGGKGVTYNALPSEGRPRIGIIIEGHRSAQKQYLNE